ncbi:DUF5362 family protein [Mucilaginibacter arboris]|uniref:Uncharacterized protein n=1 Tax=Mucilaginibacter arboris TaxID=2682090 RepID=A0A7K1SZK8_9SPHI|nr:DUF5362 family protein [Mucilaginibacter arboris]MVN22733.1 hypothetical protein [Mucilaginibacter arboris]
MEELENTEAAGEANEMLITFEAEAYLREAGKWAHFLSITGFVFSVLTIISAFSVGAIVGKLQQTYGSGLDAKALSSGLSFMYFIFGILIFVPSLYLFQFAASLKNGFTFGDQERLNTAFQKLKSYFRFWGILIISFIVFYLMVLITALLGGSVKM